MTEAQNDFIIKVGSLAAYDMRRTGIPASLTIAQAILESGWGKSGLAVKANALFGIKAKNDWNGRVYSSETKECYDGVNMTNITALFRAYDSWDESVADHSAFLRGSARYAAVVGETDYKKACYAVKAAGYATDPLYEAKIINLIETYRLYEYDIQPDGEGMYEMNIIQDFIPIGRKNRPGRANPMKYITIHNTGNALKGAGAKNHASYIKGDSAAGVPKSWHYTVDEKSVYQHLPDNETAYHAEGGATSTGNAQSIGVEICMNCDGDILSATDMAAELAANLCKKYNIPVENVVQHNKWSGKNCPQMLRAGNPYSWDTFIKRVKLMVDITKIPSVETPLILGVGCKVVIHPGAVYGGLSTSRGKVVPAAQFGGKLHTVSAVAVHHGEREAKLQEINSWVAVKYLNCAEKSRE